VTVAAETPSGVTLQFTVRDTGIGFSPEVRERLFHPFMQADSSTTRKYGGTGLGLAISKQLVELMGGTIGVESVEGLGSTFWCTVPLSRSTAAEPPRRSADAAMAPTRGPAAPDQANRILVAEDNPVNQKLALLQLQALDYPADVVPNGQAAVAAMAAQCYTLVLMDCHMPEMDGFAATTTIRAEETRGGGGRVPIIAMTANAMEGDRDRCLQAGMDDHLAKPVKVEALRGLIARWLPPRKASAPPAQAADCPAQPVLDRAVLAELHRLQMPGEPSVIDEVTAIFIDDMIAGIAGMRAAVAHGDVAALQQTAHRCRGSSAQLGATRLADLCASVEVLGRAGALTAAMQVLAQVDVEFTRVREALSHESTATPGD
jgi:CheY-like chemotaxis protein